MDPFIRILHLEDDARDAELVQATLESAGLACQITRVQTQDEFGEALGRGSFDVILADYRLPRYDGMSALRQVQELGVEVPFIFVSGVMGEDAAIEALREGATDYVLKVKLPRLAPAVERALRDAENRRERKRAEEALRESNMQLQLLSKQLVEVQEQERRHIARELHDEIGQALTGLKLLLEMRKGLTGEKAASSLDEAQQLLGDLITKVRNLSLELRPAMLDDLGLLPTLMWHLEHYTAQTRVKVIFKHAGLEGKRFTPAIETATYRIIQEALTNVARHAGVAEVTVRLWENAGVLGIQVEDRGQGFDVAATATQGRASGLTGMRERAILLGGNLTIESVPGDGTCLTAEIPESTQIERSGNDDHHTPGR